MSACRYNCGHCANHTGETKGKDNYGVGSKSGTMSLGRDVLIVSKGEENGEPI